MPSRPSATGSIASVLSAAVSIVGPFSRLLTDAECGFASAVASAGVAANATTKKDSQSLYLACHSRVVQIRHAGLVGTPIRARFLRRGHEDPDQ
jgi:hypothetical protein